MSQPDTAIDLDALTDAIVASIAEAFPVFETVEAWREDRKTLPAPACLIELVDLEPDATVDPGTEQLAVHAHFEAYVVLGFRTPQVKRAAPKLAAAVALHIRNQRWGLPVQAAQVTAIEPDDFTPGRDEYEVWRIDWQQIIHIGESVWNNDGTLPAIVLTSFAPEIGQANEESYDVVTPQAMSPTGRWDDNSEWIGGQIMVEE